MGVLIRTCTLVIVCACSTHYLGPGRVLGPHWQTSRDPDPTRDPTKMQTANPWAGEASAMPSASGGAGGAPIILGDGAGGATAKPGTKRHKLEYLAAWALTGFMPMIMWAGTFEENELAPTQSDEDTAQ